MNLYRLLFAIKRKKVQCWLLRVMRFYDKSSLNTKNKKCMARCM